MNCKSFNDARRIPRLEFDVSESEDINSFAYGLNKLVDIGFKNPAQWAHDKLQVPIAADDEPVLERKTTPEMTALLSAQHKPHQKIAVLSATRDPDDLLDELEPTPEKYQEVIDPMLKPVVEALQTGLAKCLVKINTIINICRWGLLPQKLLRLLKIYQVVNAVQNCC